MLHFVKVMYLKQNINFIFADAHLGGLWASFPLQFVLFQIL